MKKAFLGLLAIGVLVGVVLVGWELVAKPGPLRKAVWAYRAHRNPVYEARLQFNLRQALNDEQLAAENLLLDGGDVLMPVVRDLQLAATWKMAGEWAAIEKLAENSELRRGDNEFVLILAVRDSDKDLAGRIIEPLGRGYVEFKQKQVSAPGSMPADSGL